jgi:hypothetical protein
MSEIVNTMNPNEIIRSKEKPKEFDTLNYKNQEIVSRVDQVAQDILKTKSSYRHRDHFFPLLIDKLNLKIGVEIGTDKAEFALHLLNKSHLEKLYCIDSWQDDFGSNYRPNYYDKNGDVRYQQALDNLGEYYKTNRAIPIKKTSAEASKDFSDESLDFIYIDGDHSLAILLDLYYWIPKIRIGGICSGHDYKDDPKNSGIKDAWGKQLPYQIKTAVDYFTRRYGYKLHIVGGRTMSFYFVKNIGIGQI